MVGFMSWAAGQNKEPVKEERYCTWACQSALTAALIEVEKSNELRVPMDCEPRNRYGPPSKVVPPLRAIFTMEKSLSSGESGGGTLGVLNLVDHIY